MTQTMNAWLSLTLLLLIVASAAPAAAQTASSFEQLAVLVESGDRITVTDSAGRERTGRIIDLTPTALGLLTDGARHDFREAHVDTISQVRQDTLRNGAWFGLAVGAAIGATYFIPKYDIAGRSSTNPPAPRGAMQVVGDEPHHHRERRNGHDRRPGVRRGGVPRQIAMWHIAWAGSGQLTLTTSGFREVFSSFESCGFLTWRAAGLLRSQSSVPPSSGCQSEASRDFKRGLKALSKLSSVDTIQSS